MAVARTPKALLRSHGLAAKRRFGQCFLADAGISAKIAELATTPAGGTVLELGAGLGALTRPLCERARRVIAVERDRDLIPLLREALRDFIEGGRLEILEADAKAIDPSRLFQGAPPPRVLAGNLPYQITGPLLQLALRAARSVDRVVYLVQLEVADRVVARPGQKSYGALSVFLQAQFAPRRAFIVRRGAFQPQPNVDSAVMILEPLASPVAEETEAFRELVTLAFGQRRKKLKNAWQGALGLDGARLARAAERAGVDLQARGETLSAEAFARMTWEVARA